MITANMSAGKSTLINALIGEVLYTTIVGNPINDNSNVTVPEVAIAYLESFLKFSIASKLISTFSIFFKTFSTNSK